MDDELEKPAWGVWVDYKIAPPGSYACLVSRFMDNRWTDPEPQWMPAQLRPQLHGEVRVMPYLMPNDPLAAVNALPELLAVKAERDRAQRACEQMGERITALENSLREIGAAIINGASDTLWMGDQISDETVVDFICNLTGDDPSLLGTFARAALNQEAKP